jgi:putative ABC transport system substrate-binding protein
MQNNNRFCSVNALTPVVPRGSTLPKLTSHCHSKTGRLFRALLLVLVFIAYQNVAIAAPLTMGVLYPDVPEPYQNVFLNIISGLKGESGAKVVQYVVEKDMDIPGIRNWLSEQKIDVIIALGRRGLNAATQATDRIPIISGALLLTPGDEKANVEGISLAADPKALFSRLLSLVPGIQRIYVVYNPQQNAWMMKLAHQAADALNIKLVGYTAESLREAVFHYKEILHIVDPKKDALWLPIDSTTVNDQVVLPLILREAWDRDLVVFSSNPAHASKGALFSVFPDDEALGRSLAALALGVESGDSHVHPEIKALKDLKFAINRRTADHLGLSFSAQRQEKFDFVFPAR